MSADRRPFAVVIVEDTQQENLVRQALYSLGWRRHDIRVVKSPPSRGSGKAHVLQQYPIEVRAMRRAHRRQCLATIVDADTEDVDSVYGRLGAALEVAGEKQREPCEPIAILIPKRNVETWLWFLAGNAVDETTDYKLKVRGTGTNRPEAEAWTAGCRTTFAGEPPPSLSQSCPELARLNS